MTLPEEDVKLFYQLYPALLVYVNLHQNTLKLASTPEEFMAHSANERVQVRDQLYQHIGIIDSFIKDNPYGFSSQDLEIVRSWKHFIRDSFYLFRHLKKYSIFLASSSPPKAYGVLSLSDSLKDLFPFVPVMVEAVLLPFKGQIIYDGYVRTYSITFGGGIRRGFNDSYNEAKAAYGIIDSLPFESNKNAQADEEKLKFYLRSERNRNYYWEEIQDLIYENHALTVIYHQEMGKFCARSFGRRMREIGINDGWFGILEGLIVASGKTEAALEENIKSIVPQSMKEYVYLYHLKSKAPQ
jgi:hypothetical protein